MRSKFLPFVALLPPTLSHPLDPPPKPHLTPLTYHGSACPSSTLISTLTPSNTTDLTQTTHTLSFTLTNFSPTLGPIDSSLRMCDITANISVPDGWKVALNGAGTVARGIAAVPGDARLFLRGSWVVTGREDVQSIGMFDVAGPLEGMFEQRLTPEKGDVGVEVGCGGGEVVVEFQARAVREEDRASGVDLEAAMRGRSANDTAWVLGTDVVVSRC